MENKKYTITEIAKKIGKSRQAVYVAIMKNKLEAIKTDHKWLIEEKSYKEWEQNKYNRNLRTKDGKLIFDGEKTFSVAMATKKISEILENKSFTEQQLYYLLRIGKVKFSRYGGTKIINLLEITKYTEEQKKYQKKVDIF